LRLVGAMFDQLGHSAARKGSVEAFCDGTVVV
jgi:hypothetical protein